MRWRIGNGISVSVWRDKWLPQLVTFKPFSPCLDNNHINLKVCDLLLPLGAWNEALVRSIFSRR